MKYVERIRKMVLDQMQQESVNVYLFGSWARGTQRRGSDVDIAIKFQGENKPWKIAELREILEESTIPYNVDVVDMNNASEGILQEIQKDGIKWN